jgi:hypothetical protein
MNLYHTGLSEFYKEIETLGDPLTGISDRFDFERIRPILSDLFTNDTDRGGRPNYDPILMVKILLLQQWYNLSDPQIEREIRDRISFLNFLGYPERLPDRNTIWYFREMMCSLYHLVTYKREYIELKRYKGESRGGFANLLHTPGYMVI